MLKIVVPEAKDLWDPVRCEFLDGKEVTLTLEHSLVSIAKWEAIWEKPFLTNQPKTIEEYLSYIQCMTITQNVDPLVYNRLTRENITEIDNYIGRSMTATTFSKRANSSGNRINGEQITAELLYYYMFAFNIPVEFQKWHLSRLTTLIRVCAYKNEKPKKMSQKETIMQYKDLNEQRLRQLGTSG